MSSVYDVIAEQINGIAEAAHSSAKQTVLKTVEHWAAQKIDFSFDGIAVTPSLFTLVAKQIRAGKIHVKFNPFLAGEALYDSGANTMFIGLMHATKVSEMGLIIHEAVHAGMDAKALSKDTSNHKHQYMFVTDSESCAYIAQVIFQGYASHWMVQITSKAKKWQAAARLADMVVNGTALTWDDCQELRKAIAGDKEYKSIAYTYVSFDGVGA